MTRALIALAALAAPALAACQNAAAPAASCAPLGWTKEKLLAFRAGDFSADGAFDYDAFALDLVDCLGDPDPDLRDKIAYEAFARMLRNKRVDAETIKALDGELRPLLTAPDPQGFRRPFAALVLSEVARADRIDGVFTDAERGRLVRAAADYLRAIGDYRGFDETEGWRHGVAHGADLLMQLTLNDALTREQLLLIRDAISTQIVPQHAHFYIYGESARLARPIFFIAARDMFSQDEWTGWFEDIASKGAPPEQEADVSRAALARRHNLRAFASVVYINASASENDAVKNLLPGAAAMLRAGG